MGARKCKPTAPGHHGASISDFVEIIRSEPGKPLLRPFHETGGRSSGGHVITRHRGGGHKRQYQVIDFRRYGRDGVPTVVARIEYDLNRTAHVVLLHYADDKKRYVLAPTKPPQGGRIEAGAGTDIKPGDNLPLHNVPLGIVTHAIELKPGGGARTTCFAGSSIRLATKEGRFAQLRMSSSEICNVETTCRAAVGEVGSVEQSSISWGKAGRMRWKGKRPHVRGAVMNPADHPHGDGEGHTSGDRHLTSPWGKSEGRACRPNKDSDRLIVRRHKTGKNR